MATKPPRRQKMATIDMGRVMTENLPDNPAGSIESPNMFFTPKGDLRGLLEEEYHTGEEELEGVSAQEGDTVTLQKTTKLSISSQTSSFTASQITEKKSITRVCNGEEEAFPKTYLAAASQSFPVQHVERKTQSEKSTKRKKARKRKNSRKNGAAQENSQALNSGGNAVETESSQGAASAEASRSASKPPSTSHAGGQAETHPNIITEKDKLRKIDETGKNNDTAILKGETLAKLNPTIEKEKERSTIRSDTYPSKPMNESSHPVDAVVEREMSSFGRSYIESDSETESEDDAKDATCQQRGQTESLPEEDGLATLSTPGTEQANGDYVTVASENSAEQCRSDETRALNNDSLRGRDTTGTKYRSRPRVIRDAIQKEDPSRRSSISETLAREADGSFTTIPRRYAVTDSETVDSERRRHNYASSVSDNEGTRGGSFASWETVLQQIEDPVVREKLLQLKRPQTKESVNSQMDRQPVVCESNNGSIAVKQGGNKDEIGETLRHKQEKRFSGISPAATQFLRLNRFAARRDAEARLLLLSLEEEDEETEAEETYSPKDEEQTDEIETLMGASHPSPAKKARQRRATVSDRVYSKFLSPEQTAKISGLVLASQRANCAMLGRRRQLFSHHSDEESSDETARSTATTSSDIGAERAEGIRQKENEGESTVTHDRAEKRSSTSTHRARPFRRRALLRFRGIDAESSDSEDDESSRKASEESSTSSRKNKEELFPRRAANGFGLTYTRTRRGSTDASMVSAKNVEPRHRRASTGDVQYKSSMGETFLRVFSGTPLAGLCVPLTANRRASGESTVH